MQDCNCNCNCNIRYNGLDIAKFIMAIFIVMLHSSLFIEISYNIHYLFEYAITRVGVPFFFIVSGFLLYRKIDIKKISFKAIKKYNMHILRLYSVWSLLYLPIIIHDNIIKDNKGVVHGIIIVFRNTIMSGSYLHLWFLQALIVSSLIVTILLYFKVSTKMIFLISGILYCVGLLGQAYYSIFDFFFPNGTLIYNVCNCLEKIFVTPRNGICFGFLFFFIGVYLSHVNVQISKEKNIKYIMISFLALSLEVMLGSFYELNKQSDVSWIPGLT